MIRWEEIEIEAGNYKDGFVALFKKYEGQETDEKDGQGNTVMVEAKSFARHMGIAPETFRRWLKRDSQSPTVVLSESKEKTKEIEKWHLTRAVRQDPEAVIKAVAELPAEAQRIILNGIQGNRLSQAGATASANRREALDRLTTDSARIAQSLPSGHETDQTKAPLSGHLSMIELTEKFSFACRRISGMISDLAETTAGVDFEPDVRTVFCLYLQDDVIDPATMLIEALSNPLNIEDFTKNN